MPVRVNAKEIEFIGSKMVPNQPISMAKLVRLTGLSLEKIGAFKRHMEETGLVTSSLKRTGGRGSAQLTLHREPVPEGQRTRYRRGANVPAEDRLEKLIAERKILIDRMTDIRSRLHIVNAKIRDLLEVD